MREFRFDLDKMDNGELADLIHELNNELGDRCKKINTGSWLNDQLEAASLNVRSWSTTKQMAMKGSI